MSRTVLEATGRGCGISDGKHVLSRTVPRVRKGNRRRDDLRGALVKGDRIDRLGSFEVRRTRARTDLTGGPHDREAPRSRTMRLLCEAGPPEAGRSSG